MATKTTKKKIETNPAELTGDALAEHLSKLDAERAELQAKQRAEQAAVEQAEAESRLRKLRDNERYVLHRKTEFSARTRGVVDGAIAAFTEAVTSGGDVFGAYAAYRDAFYAVEAERLRPREVEREQHNRAVRLARGLLSEANAIATAWAGGTDGHVRTPEARQRWLQIHETLEMIPVSKDMRPHLVDSVGLAERQPLSADAVREPRPFEDLLGAAWSAADKAAAAARAEAFKADRAAWLADNPEAAE